MNEGKCININKCRCPQGFGGDHCEIDNRQQTAAKCKRPCRNGTCMANHHCRCNKGWIGRFCNKHGKILPLNFKNQFDESYNLNLVYFRDPSSFHLSNSDTYHDRKKNSRQLIFYASKCILSHLFLPVVVIIY